MGFSLFLQEKSPKPVMIIKAATCFMIVFYYLRKPGLPGWVPAEIKIALIGNYEILTLPFSKTSPIFAPLSVNPCTDVEVQACFLKI